MQRYPTKRSRYENCGCFKSCVWHKPEQCRRTQDLRITAATAVVITLLPGESLNKHIMPVDVFFYVLEGTGVIEIGNEKQTVGRDMFVESPARIPHCWINESAAVFRVLVVKVPGPTEETRLL